MRRLMPPRGAAARAFDAIDFSMSPPDATSVALMITRCRLYATYADDCRFDGFFADIDIFMPSHFLPP